MALKHYDIKVRVYNEVPAFGKGIVMLLDLIDEYGSLSKAYRQMGMAASKAWKILHRAEADLGVKLVESLSGGKNGGNSRLTKEGKEYVLRYHMMMEEINTTTKAAFEKYFGDENE